jgi:hypothetical protein
VRGMACRLEMLVVLDGRCGPEGVEEMWGV